MFAQDDKLVRRSGKYEVTLRPPVDGLYAREEQQIEFRIVDTGRVDPVMGATPVVRARIDSAIDMPAMAGMPKIAETSHPEGVPGEYGLHPTFAHGGEYRLRLQVAPPAGDPFEVEYALDVKDSREGKARIAPFTLSLKSSPGSPKAGEPVDLAIALFPRERPKEAVREYDTVHEKKMHLIAVRADLGTFEHLHPEPSPDGIFRLRHAFATGGEYSLFADVAPKGKGSQVLAGRLKVSGSKGPKYDIRDVPLRRESDVEGGRFEMADATLSVGRTFSVGVAVTVPQLKLTPYLGAMGHLMIVHEDGQTLVHAHPDDVAGMKKTGTNSATIPFLVRFPKPGRYRAWVEVVNDGRKLTPDFVIEAGK